MESLILKEGCDYLINKGVYIDEFIADADANTYKVLKYAVPRGSKIKKVDCANHMARNFRTYLEN